MKDDGFYIALVLTLCVVAIGAAIVVTHAVDVRRCAPVVQRVLRLDTRELTLSSGRKVDCVVEEPSGRFMGCDWEHARTPETGLAPTGWKIPKRMVQ